MVVAGAIVLDCGFECSLRGQRTKQRVREGSTSRQGFELGAITKKARSKQGQENVLQAPG